MSNSSTFLRGDIPLSWYDNDDSLLGTSKHSLPTAIIEQEVSAPAPAQFLPRPKTFAAHIQQTVAIGKLMLFTPGTFGAVSANHSFTRTPSFDTILLHLFRSDMLNDYDLSALFVVCRDYQRLYDTIIADHSLDFNVFHLTSNRSKLT